MNVDAHSSFELDPESFRAIADLAYRESGLTLVKEKSSMVRSRLRHRLRELGLTNFSAYSDLLQSEAGQAERRHLISALTTNVSHFFREDHHFNTLRDEFDRRLPELRSGGTMRIWSAGCSQGQEAFSVAMTLAEHAADLSRFDLRILGTDIDKEVIEFARQGAFPVRLMSGVPQPLRDRYFEQIQSERSDPHYRVRPELIEMIRFNELNLLGPWPMNRKFDVIFCRNVVIYFDAETQARLWPRLRDALAPNGVLFLGHSERIPDPCSFGFDCTGPTTYRPRLS